MPLAGSSQPHKNAITEVLSVISILMHSAQRLFAPARGK